MTQNSPQPSYLGHQLHRGYAWLQAWKNGKPGDVETEYLRSLFRSHISNSPVCIFATLFLYASAQQLPAGNATFYWVVANVAYHSIRTLVGLAYLRRLGRPSQELRYWGLLSFLLQALDGALLLSLALFIYPHLDPLGQVILLMACLIIVGSTATSLAWRWASMAVFAPPAYLGFAWASWSVDHMYAHQVSVLVLMFFVLYLFQAFNHRAAVTQALDLARRNGELARGHGELAVELQLKNIELQELASARSRLLATVSHDLRQPSHAIGLLCERMIQDPNPVQLPQALRDLNELSQSLSASLTTLMDLTRLDAGLVRANLEPVLLGQVLLRLEAEFSASAKNRGIELQVANSPLWVRTDPVLLHGVLANLLSNAIKYTRAGLVSVELQAQDGQVCISVRDTGMGIKQDKLELIFKEFVRLEGAESGTEGLGLGLSIVRRYAMLLGHPLSVASQPGLGSCFSISLPLIEVSHQQAAVQALNRSMAVKDERLAGLKVLVVDNVDLVLSTMVRTLSAWGCEVYAARSLSEAQALAVRQPLNVLISDFHLGDEEPDGLTLIRTLRASPGQAHIARLPALLMTGDVSGQLEAEARRIGVDVLHKPVRPAVLQERMLSLLQQLPVKAA